MRGLSAVAVLAFGLASAAATAADTPQVLTGQAGYGAWKQDAPGVRRKITATDLPAPYATGSVREGAQIVAQPASAQLAVLPGFSVALFADDLRAPREIRVAPNGDVFVAESRDGRIRVLRGTDKAEQNEVFADGLDRPFGIAFYPPGPDPQFVYVANTNSIVHLPCKNGDLKASGPAETIFAALHGSWNRHLRTGYKIVRAILKDGVPTGEYEDFVTGFITDDGNVWGRPVGVAVAKDGALLFSEDGNGTIWRVSYSGARAEK